MKRKSPGILFPCILFLLAISFSSIAQVPDPDGPSYEPFAGTHDGILKSVAAINSNPLLEDYDIKFYKLDLEADNISDQIRGNVTILARVQNNPLSTMVVELYNGLAVDRILLNGEEKQFSHEGDEISIPLGNPLDTGDMVRTQIFYSGQTGEGMVTQTEPGRQGRLSPCVYHHRLRTQGCFQRDPHRNDLFPQWKGEV